jgi:hypothetical protein
MDPVPHMKVAPADIHERYANLRIIWPQAESAMERSLRLYGQMAPVILGRVEDAYEMVDGFKRLRAARKLGLETLCARIFPGGARAMKAAIIHFNTRSRTMAELETGMVIRSLHREDGLSQVEIAALLGRHKSFVCRRLRMVEELSEEVIEHLKLGLINMTIGRELSRLPRGNQAPALRTVIKYRLDCAETCRLVSRVLSRPSWDHGIMLHFPEEILMNRQPERPRVSGFMGRLFKMEAYLASVSDAELKKCRREETLATIGMIVSALSEIEKRLC